MWFAASAATRFAELSIHPQRYSAKTWIIETVGIAIAIGIGIGNRDRISAFEKKQKPIAMIDTDSDSDTDPEFYWSDETVSEAPIHMAYCFFVGDLRGNGYYRRAHVSYRQCFRKLDCSAVRKKGGPG